MKFHHHILWDYRPILLIGNIYRIIAKVLATRCHLVMPNIIKETKYAFIGGRNILDSVSIVTKVIHEAKSWDKPPLLFKVNFEKMYNNELFFFVLYAE
uniref:Reverse transcriptase domain-containing protein n=1 Tax=Cajanus cajan TaxID=3821 RepID=A0A151SGZ5_CAJCA|nr:hypothetical protein KK1_000205 [Cajanus cajan]